MFDVEGFILVGGASSRMGQDKSQLMLGSETTVERLTRQLSSITSRIRLVGSRYQPNQGLENVSDVHADWGALGGIHAALNACRTEWAAVVACDLPFITRELWSRLLQIAGEKYLQTPDAVVPIQSDLRPQPMCAVYRQQPCLKEATRLIAVGEHTPRALLAAVNTRWINFEEVADLPNAEYFFFNVNTPGDYERAKQIVRNDLR